MTILTIILTLAAGIAFGYLLGQTAGHWSQQSRYEEGWRDGMNYGGHDGIPEEAARFATETALCGDDGASVVSVVANGPDDGREAENSGTTAATP